MKSLSFDTTLISKYRTELMGLAIIGVMAGHIMNHTFQPAILRELVRLIHTSGFIFLSGFGLYYSFSKDDNIKQYAIKRYFRLYVPYLKIALPFFTALLLTSRCDIFDYFNYLLTTAFWYKGNCYAMWYISISVLLYVLFPFIYRCLFNKYDKPFLICATIVISCFSLFLLIHNSFPSYWSMTKIGLTKCAIFPLGIYAGYLSKHKFIIPARKTTLCILIIILLGGVTYRVDNEIFSIFRTCLGIPISCIVLRWINCNSLNNILRFFGKYSLVLYLTHVLINFTLLEFTSLSNTQTIITGVFISLLLCVPINKSVSKHVWGVF